MKNGKGYMSLKPFYKSPPKEIQLMRTNQNIRQSYFSVLRNLTKDKSSILMPSVEKKPIKYLEDLYAKYAANLEVYLINNKRDIKLYGSRRYENESFDTILNDIKSNKGKVIEKLRCKPLPCSITEYDDDKIILTPLPNKARQTLESSKDKEEFFNAERQAVVMRTVEYTHAVRSKQNSEERIKAIRDYEQHSTDKNNRLMMLKLFKKPVKVIETWWFGLKKRRNKERKGLEGELDGSNYCSDIIEQKERKTTPQESNTLNYIDNYYDSTVDYGFDNQKTYQVNQSGIINNSTIINTNANVNSNANANANNYLHIMQLAARVIFNRIESKEKELFNSLIRELDSKGNCVEGNESTEKEKEYLIFNAKLLAMRFIFYKIRDEERNIFNRLIRHSKGRNIANVDDNKNPNSNSIRRKQLEIAKDSWSIHNKGIKTGFNYDDLEEESEYYFELIAENESNTDDNYIQQNKSNKDYSDDSYDAYDKPKGQPQPKFALIEIEYDISFQIEGEETFYDSKISPNEGTNLKSHFFKVLVIDYVESIQIYPDYDDTDDDLCISKEEKEEGDKNEYNNNQGMAIRNQVCLNIWASVSRVTYIDSDRCIDNIKLIQDYYRFRINANKAEDNNTLNTQYRYSNDQHSIKSQNSLELINTKLNKKLRRLKNEEDNEDIIHKAPYDTKSSYITKERKCITLIAQHTQQLQHQQQPKSRNAANPNLFKPTKSEDIQIHSKRNKAEELNNNDNNNKSFDEEVDKSIRDKLLKTIISTQNKKINKEMKELEESFHNSSSKKSSLLQFTKRKLPQISALHFNKHFKEYFSLINAYTKPESPLIKALNIYKHKSIYPKLMKWYQNTRKTIYLKKRISEVTIAIHLQITKRKLIKLLSIIGRSSKQNFFYRMILIYMLTNDININYNPIITFINQGFANQYLFSLANALSLDLTKPLAQYERHAFLPYIKTLIQLDPNPNTNYNDKNKTERLNKTTDEIPKEHLSLNQNKNDNVNSTKTDLYLKDSSPKERNTITVKTISLKKK